MSAATATPIDVAGERLTVYREARRWIGTPFHHAQRVLGAGVDCAHLLLACFADTGIVTLPSVGYYSANWFLHQDASPLEEILRDYCVPVDHPVVGDIVAFRFGRAVAHAGIIGAWPEIVHADRLQGRVTITTVERDSHLASRLAGFWRLKRWGDGG